METSQKTTMPSNHPAVPIILVTGATGTIGSELTRLLSQRGIPFRAMVRSKKDVQALCTLSGADVVEGDFNDPDSLANALRGIERAFLLTPSLEQAEAQQLRFAEQAQRAEVRHIVKLSQLAARPDSPVRFLRYHAVVERAIRAGGLDFTFLRPNLFMQGLLNFRPSIVGQGQFFAAIGEAEVSVVDVRDIAAVAAAALTEPNHAGRIYILTGPEALTHAQLAQTLSDALGKTVTFVSISGEQMREALRTVGFPDWQADGLIEDYAHYDRNEAAAVTTDVTDVTGQLPRSFTQFAHDYRLAFA